MRKLARIATIASVPVVAGLLVGVVPASAHTDNNVTEVTFWGDWSGQGEKQFDAMVNRFNATHKNIHVTYVVQQNMITKFLTASTSGQAPDIMFWDRWQTALYAPKGVLYPIDNFIKRDNINLNDYFSEALREMTWNKHLYGLPLTVDARVLFYNKTMFKKAGITHPPNTWDELEQDAKRLTIWKGNKLVQAGFSLDDVGLFNMWLQQAGGQMVTNDGSKTAFNNAKGLEVLNFWNKLLNIDKVYQVGFASGLPNGEDGFSAGKVAMMYSGPWMISTYKKYSNLDFGVAQPPKGPGPDGRRASIMGGFSLVIPAAAKHKEAAWEFEKWWLAQPKNALYWAQESDNIPGNLKAVNTPFFQKDPYLKPIVDTLKYAKIRPPFAGYPDVEIKGTIPTFQLFLAGKLTAKQALDRAQQIGDQVLEQENVH
ncbi:MAG: ABC transporter substrate-binding protein [Alicyclobacillus sp.]|nr:ABC transporter substrate-binding protein [Alicyclobacillus sp.]